MEDDLSAVINERSDIMAGTKQYEPLSFKLAETWIDASAQTQERTAKLGESYIKAFQEGQKASFDLVLGWMKLMRDLRTLSFDYVQESARTGNEALSSLIRVQDEVRHDLKDRFDQQVTEIEKVAKAAK
jgi:hypothetical protein